MHRCLDLFFGQLCDPFEMSVARTSEQETAHGDVDDGVGPLR